MIMSIKNRVVQGAAVVGGVVVTGVASAAGEADAAVTLLTTDGAAAITAVGGAMLGLAAIAVIFKWVKASIFS